MADDQTFLLMTGGHGAFKVMPEAAELPDVVTRAAKASASHMALLHFDGVMNDDIQGMNPVQFEIAMALPDLVLYKDQIDEMIARAVQAGILELRPHARLVEPPRSI